MRMCAIGLIVTCMLLPAGCKHKQERIPIGSFRADVENLVDDDLILVKHVTLTAHGKRAVSVSEEAGVDKATIEPDPQTGLMTARVIFVADLIKLRTSSENLLRWLVRVKTNQVTVGGPALSPVGSAGKLQEVMALKIESGIYALSQDIELGNIQGRKLTLRVE